jgi:transcriptional regulator with XRE-family HTH domain
MAESGHRRAGERVRRPNVHLRRHRLLRGWSQQEEADRLLRLAESAGIPGLRCAANLVSRWERGTRRPAWPYTQLYQTTADQLGLVPPETSVEGVQDGRIDHVERRDFMKYGLGLAASAALVDWDGSQLLRRTPAT